MPFVITDACVDVKDGSCVAVCPVDCIHESASQFYIVGDECIDCALCVPVCPVDAIYDQALLPEEMATAVARNAELAALDGSEAVQ